MTGKFAAIALSAVAVVLLVVCLPVGFWPAPSEAQTTGGGGGTVRIAAVDAIGRGLPPRLLKVTLRPFKAYMEEQTGKKGEIVAGGPALDLARKLSDDKVQVGVFPGHEFAWARAKYPRLRPVVVCVNKTPKVKVHLVTLKESKAATYADLEGKTVALARNGGADCRLYLDRRCVKPGVAAEKFYKEVLSVAGGEEALDAVVDGKAAAAVVDAVHLEEYRSGHPRLARHLESVQESEPFPPGVVAYFSGRFTARDVAAFQRALVRAKSNASGRQMLRSLRLSGFQAPGDDFDESMKAIAKAYPPKE